MSSDSPAIRRGRPRWLAIVLIAGVAVAVGALYFGIAIEPYDLRIVRRDIPCPGLQYGPIRILLFSDVDFPGYRSNLDRVAAEARLYDPDLVLVAGDFLDRDAMVADATVRAEALAWFQTLPARGRRLLAPGEAESPRLGVLRSAWPPDEIEALANESRRFEIRGERLDVFSADRRTDPALWRVVSQGGRWMASAECDQTDTYIQLRRSESATWRDVDVTFALRRGPADGRILIRLAADPAAHPSSGAALVVTRDEDTPAFRVYARGPGRLALTGRLRSAYVPAVGAWTRCRFRLTNGADAIRLQARFWPDGTNEPAHWMIDASLMSPERPRHGTIALGGERASLQIADLTVANGSGDVLFHDDFDDAVRFRDDWEQWSRLGAWLDSPRDGSVRLVLAHTPDVALDLTGRRDAAIALVLAGHTHGGQVKVPLIGPLWSDSRLGRSFDRGLFRVAETPLFITAGVGTSVIPIRLGVPPDAAFLTLVPTAKQGRAVARHRRGDAAERPTGLRR